MKVLTTIPQAQKKVSEHLKTKRLKLGFTQAGLAKRSGVSLPTLRKFEQKGLISLESFLKLLMVLGGVEKFIDALKPEEQVFQSIADIEKEKRLSSKSKQRKRGWRK